MKELGHKVLFVVPNNDLILRLGSYLFDYRFGFDPNSKACDECCSDDYYIKIMDELIDCKHHENDKKRRGWQSDAFGRGLSKSPLGDERSQKQRIRREGITKTA